MIPPLPMPDPTVPTLTVVSAKARAGKTADVKFELTNNPGIAGAVLTLAYDDALSLTQVTVGSALKELEFTPPGDLTANPAVLLWDGEVADSSNGTILTLTFAIPEGTPEGEYAVTVTCKPDDVYDAKLKDISPAIVNGIVTVTNVRVGDLNNDEIIDGKDVTLLRRSIAGGYGVTVDPAAADTNHDGRINAKDVTVLRRYIVGGYGITLD